MRERPLLMSYPMVLAILDDSKTQTRRIVKPRTLKIIDMAASIGECHELKDMGPQHPNSIDYYADLCPYGKPGDRLWVRETARALEEPSGRDVVEYLADGFRRPISDSQRSVIEWLDMLNYGQKMSSGLPNPRTGKTVPSIHMPRWASRITLEITGVCVERLQAISEVDALAEGVHAGIGEFDGCFWIGNALSGTTAKECYARLWESINGTGSWDANPWVWVIEFKRVPSLQIFGDRRP